MIQKKRIKKKAKEKFGGNDVFNERRLGFIEGAEWMLNNQWISVDDELPEEDGVYLVLVNSKMPLITTFNRIKRTFEPYRPYNITHWMPMPSLKENNKK